MRSVRVQTHRAKAEVGARKSPRKWAKKRWQRPYYAKGNCKRGDNCYYSHTEKPTAAASKDRKRTHSPKKAEANPWRLRSGRASSVGQRFIPIRRACPKATPMISLKPKPQPGNCRSQSRYSTTRFSRCASSSAIMTRTGALHAKIVGSSWDPNSNHATSFDASCHCFASPKRETSMAQIPEVNKTSLVSILKSVGAKDGRQFRCSC